MLRSRVIVVSAFVLGIIVVLEALGIIAGRRVDATIEQAVAWTQEVTMNAELDAYMVRAAGEGASAFLADSDDYADEAREALAEARARLDQLRRRDLEADGLRRLASALRSRQAAMIEQLSDALAPLERRGDIADRSAAVRAVYAYEVGIRALRERMAAFAARAVELSEERTARWQGIDEGLAVLRMAVLVVLVLALARLLQRRVVAPLAELSAAARAVCSGDFASRVSETGGDEVGDLQRAFNAMGTRLRGYDDDSRRSQHELSEALERSEAANRSKSDFVASISHELRTPMHGVIGMAELLLREDIDDEVRERVDAIHTSASGLLAVINDILDFSRLEADRTRLRSEPLDLRELVSECIALLSSRACERAVELRMEIDAGVPMWVLGDADRLRQVLNNLVGNAVKFTEEGRVTVRVCRAEGADGRLQVAIEDTGVGIAADALERIFEPFVQADGSIQRRHGGTGLGLAISRRLVDAMGGRIAVRSVPGSGTEFSFEIALEPCAPPSDDTVADPKLAQIGAHLLIAEDHPVNQALARRMMTKLGCTFEIAADGKEAVAAFERSRFDLVLMDCHMPEMDGYHATRAIRELEAGTASRIPIVAMTAGAMDSDRAAARDAGMDDFLTKPFSLGDLQRLLERWVRRSERG